MDLDMGRTPRVRPRALCVPVIGVLLVLGSRGGSGGDSLPSRTASAELPTVSASIDRTLTATSTAIEAPTTDPTPARTPIRGQLDTSAESTDAADSIMIELDDDDVEGNRDPLLLESHLLHRRRKSRDATDTSSRSMSATRPAEVANLDPVQLR